MGAVFGKPSSGSSKNVNNGLLTDSLSPTLGYVQGGGDMMGNLLGVNGAAGSTAGLQAFANSGGMNFLRDQGMAGITSSQAAKGLLNSGSTLKAMDKFNNGLASTYLNQYMNQLNDYSKLGLGSAAVLADSGKTEQQKGAKPGLFQLMQQAGQNAGQAAAAGG